MKCPHCRTEFHDDEKYEQIHHADVDGNWFVGSQHCPSCERIIIFIINGEAKYSLSQVSGLALEKKRFLVYPKGSSRPPCPIEVPNEFAEDYSEACIVLQDSPKASAALSRRCLQNILREIAKVKPQDLYHEIQEVIDKGNLPSHLIAIIDAVRNVGNFSAHPMKSQKTGEIIAVEPHEAEWNLDVLEALFDFYFVQPEVIKKKRDALNQKLSEAGKKPML
jgi:hypothetical protein